MTRRRAALCGALSAGLLAVLGGCGGSGAADARFELRCDPGCGPDEARLLADLEAVRDSVRSWFGALPPGGASDPRPVDRRPAGLRGGGGIDRVRFHGSAASFERADRRLASGRYREQRAFSHARTRTAHILSELEPDPATWGRWGPGPHGERLAVHEAVHLATYRVALDAGWPAWVAEGVAGQLEEGWVEARARRGGGAGGAAVRGDPWLDTRHRARAAVAASGGLPTTAAFLRGGLEEAPLGTRYALWAGFMGTLLDPPFRASTLAFMGELAAAPPPGGWSEEAVARRFERIFDSATRAAIDKRFRERVREAQPVWLELRRASGHDGTHDGTAWLVQRPAGRDALLWRPADAAPPEYARLRVTVAFRAPGPEEGAVLLALGTTAGEGIGVRVDGSGRARPVRVPLDPEVLPELLVEAAGAKVPVARVVTVDRPAGSEMDAPGSSAGGHGGERLLELELSLGAGTLRLSVEGGTPLAWPVPGIEPDGAWGIGTAGRTVARWLHVEPGT